MTQWCVEAGDGLAFTGPSRALTTALRTVGAKYLQFDIICLLYGALHGRDVTVPCLQLRLQLNEFVVEVLVVLHVVTTQSARTISRHKDDTRNAAGNITIADACCYSVIQAVR